MPVRKLLPLLYALLLGAFLSFNLHRLAPLFSASGNPPAREAATANPARSAPELLGDPAR